MCVTHTYGAYSSTMIDFYRLNQKKRRWHITGNSDTWLTKKYSFKQLQFLNSQTFFVSHVTEIISFNNFGILNKTLKIYMYGGLF